jgi:hypothetical protein
VAQTFIDDDQPVISVDTKKKELIGEDANGGVERNPQGRRNACRSTTSPSVSRRIPLPGVVRDDDAVAEF